jgi:hypothetical protein
VIGGTGEPLCSGGGSLCSTTHCGGIACLHGAARKSVECLLGERIQRTHDRGDTVGVLLQFVVRRVRTFCKYFLKVLLCLTDIQFYLGSVLIASLDCFAHQGGIFRESFADGFLD